MKEKKKRKGFLAEFRAFALQGNMIDLAVGVIIGGAFGSITKSLAGDLIMPVAGLFLGGMDLSGWTVQMGPILPGKEAVLLKIGSFVQTVIDFLILAFVVFLIIRFMNALRDRFKKPEEPETAPDPEPSKEELLLAEIRDILKEQPKHE